MTAPMTREELPTDEESLANFVYSIRSFDEAEAKAKLLWPMLGPAQTSWQPIETAPKDGTPILVDFSKHGIHRVIWDNPFDWGEGTKIWCVDDQKHGPYPLRGYSESDEAGWMPLPPPSNQGASK